LASSKEFLKSFVLISFFSIFFLTSLNSVKAALPYSYVGVGCEWGFKEVDSKIHPVLNLRVYAGTRDYTALETAGYAGQMILGAIPAITTLAGIHIGEAVANLGLKLGGDLGYKIWDISMKVVGTSERIAGTLSGVALQTIPLVSTVYTFASSLGVEPPKELGPVDMSVVIKVDDSTIQTSQASLKSGFTASIEINYNLEADAQHKIRAEIHRTGGEKVYEKSGMFYEEKNDWVCEFEWKGRESLDEFYKAKLCAAQGLHIEGTWINSQQIQINVTSSEYCAGYRVDIIGCGYQIKELDENGKANFILEGCENGAEVYAFLAYPQIESNKIKIIYPSSYITEDQREGDELKVSPSEADRFIQSNYPEDCLDWKIVRIVAGIPDVYHQSVEAGEKISGIFVAVYDKGKIVCEGYTDERGIVSCEPFDCFDRIVVGNAPDYKISEYKISHYMDQSGVEPYPQTLFIILNKIVKGYAFKIWVRGRTSEGSNGVANAVVTLIQKTGPFGSATVLTDSGGIATFTAIPGPARLIIRANGYKTYDEDITIPSTIIDVANFPSTSPYLHHQYEVLLEPGESSGCAVIADKQTIGCGDSVNVNIACFENCQQSYYIDCGNEQTTKAEYCRVGLCANPGQCKYECGDVYKFGDKFIIKSDNCDNATVVIETVKEKFIVSVSPYQKVFINPSYDIDFLVVTSKEAECEFEPSSLPFGGIPSSEYFGKFSSKDGKTHTYTFSQKLLTSDGLYSFLVKCYEKTTNALDTATISFTISKYVYDFVKNLGTPVSLPICVYSNGKPVEGVVVLLNVADLSSLQYHHPVPSATKSDGCTVLDFLAPKYGDFNLLVCLGVPKGREGYLEQQCKKIEWSYPPRPLIVTFNIENGIETVQDVKYRECEEKQLKITFDPSGPFSISDCNNYPNFKLRVVIEGICTMGNEKYFDPYAFADARATVVKKGEECPSKIEDYTTIFSLYGIRTGSSLSHYLTSLSTPCEDGDYSICVIANDTLGIYNSTNASVLLHIGELKNCKISSKVSCKRSSEERVDANADLKIENCVKPYRLDIRYDSKYQSGAVFLDYCSFDYEGSVQKIYDLDAYEYITLPGSVTQEFSCSGSVPGYTALFEELSFILSAQSEKTFTSKIILNCTEEDSGEISIAPS
jgi:hypothetical protein